jgi:hypothetical protein
MNLQIITKRNSLICEIWEKERGTITMQDLADMFGITLSQIYRIIKAQSLVKKLSEGK